MDMPKPNLQKRRVNMFQTKGYSYFIENVWKNNPIFGMVLGLCSSLAVTTSLMNALVMGISVLSVVTISSLIVSITRSKIPERVRMITFMLIISTMVISVDRILSIFIPDISKALGPYVGLIITNCIIMGRAEAFAIKHNPLHTVLDSLGAGLGYTFSIMFIAFIRELLGFGALFGVNILGEGWTNWGLMTIAPGAFFLLGILSMVANIIRKAQSKER